MICRKITSGQNPIHWVTSQRIYVLEGYVKNGGLGCSTLCLREADLQFMLIDRGILVRILGH